MFGGSWGSTLALAYAETHPERVTELVLRGIFLLRREEIELVLSGGHELDLPRLRASPSWSTSRRPSAATCLRAYYARLTSARSRGATARPQDLERVGGAHEPPLPGPRSHRAHGGDEFTLAFARIEAHYFVHDGWLTEGRELLPNIGSIRHIPGVIVQGRYDVVCPAKSAWDLHAAWPESELLIVPDAGHSASEPGIIHELVSATDRFASR